MYSYRTRIGYSQTDMELALNLPSLLNFFQDAAIYEAEAGKINMAYLQQKQLAWILGSWQIVIEEMPRLNQEVIITTNPYAFKGFIGYRNFTMETDEGRILAKGASIWTLLDVCRHRPVRADEEIMSGYTIGPKLEMDYAPRRIETIGEPRREQPFIVRGTQIDSNRHVNNAEYVKMAMEYLPHNCRIKELRVEYKKSALFQDVITPLVFASEGRVQIELVDDAQEIYAIVEFSYEEKGNEEHNE